MTGLRVVIADDHAIVREGVRMILSAHRDIQVVGEASGGEQAVAMARSLRPDVVIMDISMPGMNGIEATQRIRQQATDVNVLALTMHEDDHYVFQLLRAGAAGYVLTRAAATDLVDAVRAAVRGVPFLYPSAAKGVVEDYLRRVDRGEAERKPYDGLTAREREVLSLIAEGHTNADIAGKLFISIKTVQTHRAHIFEKLGLHDRTELVRYAIRVGLIEP